MKKDKMLIVGAIFFTIIAVIGLLAFVGKIRMVNIGAVVFPGIIAGYLFCKYKSL